MALLWTSNLSWMVLYHYKHRLPAPYFNICRRWLQTSVMPPTPNFLCYWRASMAHILATPFHPHPVPDTRTFYDTKKLSMTQRRMVRPMYF